MNKKQTLQVSLAAFFIVYIILLFLSPGWKASKILGILGSVFSLLAIYISPITTYAVFHDGEYVTNEQMNDKRFLKMIGK